MAEKNGELKMLEVSRIVENPVALRIVDKTTERYRGLVDSIRDKGILNPISVRETKDKESGKMAYAVTDGLHRFSAAQDAGLTKIPVFIRNFNDHEIIEAQIIANAHKIETQPTQYAEAIKRLFIANPMLTMQELSDTLHKSPSWISKMLSLIRITNQKLRTLVDEGKIPVANAQALATLPEEEQENFADRAQTQPSLEFVPTVNARVKEIRDARRKGRTVAPEGLLILPNLRKLSEFKNEMNDPHAGPALVHQLNVSSPQEAFALGVKWSVRLDPPTLDTRKQQAEEQKKMKEEAARKQKAERAQERARKAAEEAAALAV